MAVEVAAIRRPGFNQAMDQVAELAERWQPELLLTDQMAMVAVMEELEKREVRCKGVP